MMEFNFSSARNCYMVLLEFPKRPASTLAGVSFVHRLPLSQWCGIQIWWDARTQNSILLLYTSIYDAKYTSQDMQIASNCKYQEHIRTLHRSTSRVVGKWISPSFVAPNFNQSLSRQQKPATRRQEDLLQLNPAAMAITGLPQKAW